MADHPGILDDRFGGLDQNYVTGGTYDMETPPGLIVEDDFTIEEGLFEREGEPSSVSVDRPGILETATMGDTWFEILHVFPLRIDLGNILTTVTANIELYNADRFQEHSLDTFVNNAGEGVTITDLPSLPETLLSQKGINLTLEVTPDGPPTIDGTLDFGFDLYLIPLPITGSRLVVFPFEPEAPLQENLAFLTDVLRHIDDSEQRVALRKNPRQEFPLRFLRTEGEERSRFDFYMFDWQARLFGLPVWVESTFLTAAASSGATIISVDSTASADFRVGSLAIIYQDEQTFDALEVAAVGPTSLTFASPLTRDYSEETTVMPMRTAIANPSTKGKRYPVGMAERAVLFRVTDNDVGDAFADDTPYRVDDASSIIDGEIFLPGPNVMSGSTVDESFDRSIVVFDGETGKLSHDSPTDFNLHGFPFGFFVRDRETLWKVRRLLHALKGRQVSFYVPSAWGELDVTQTVPNGSSTITIRNVGYTRFAQQRNRYRLIRITLTDGTVYDAQVTNSGELSETEEQLTLSTVAPREIAPEEFRRVEFIQKVRLDADTVKITHVDNTGQALITFPVRTVNE